MAALTTKKMTLRPLLLLLLAALLVFAQQGAYVHALTHLDDTLGGQQQSSKGLPHSHACDKCVEYAGVGSAAASTPPVIAFHCDPVASPPALRLVFRSEASVPYLGRGPPFLA